MLVRILLKLIKDFPLSIVAKMPINGEIIRLGNCSLSGKNLCKSKLVTENQVCIWEDHVELTEKK